MGAEELSDRAIIGRFFQTLEERAVASWTDGVSMLFQSDQESETYKWLGQVPMLREWIGERQAKGLTTYGVTIENLDFEATLEILRKELKFDKTDQIMVRIDELAVRSIQHWNKLLSALIEAGAATACYDAQNFFDTDHSEESSGTQDNDLATTVAAVTGPTVAEMESMILTAIQQILSFKDNQGEPMNDGAKGFLVMVPTGYMKVAVPAVYNQVIVSGSASRDNTLLTLRDKGFNIGLEVNPRLATPSIVTSGTGAFYVFRTDGMVKPFIRQEQEPVTLDVIGTGSEQEIMSKRHIYGVKAARNVGYGYWQHGCLMTVTNG